MGSIGKIERTLVLCRVVAWRIARLMRLGRTCPELNAKLMFEPDEWNAACSLSQQKVPSEPPSLNQRGAPGKNTGPRRC